MAKVTSNEMKILADLIVEKIREEFQAKHLSGNLADTIYIDYDGSVPKVVIPARTYNMLKYQNDGVIVYNYKGSYASKLNETGSEFYRYTRRTRKGSKRAEPHNHIGFIDRAVNAATEQWVAMLGGKYSLVRKEKI